MLFEALVAAGFFALAVPFGFLSRIVRASPLPPAKKWPLFLGLVHTPVLPLIALVNLSDVTPEYEVLLVAFILLGHVTGVLAHRLRSARRAPAASPVASVEK